ncbi:unnamed protein product, partial [Adineta steineri]
ITSSITESLAQTCRIACGIVGLSNAAGEACNTEGDNCYITLADYI